MMMGGRRSWWRRMQRRWVPWQWRLLVVVAVVAVPIVDRSKLDLMLMFVVAAAVEHRRCCFDSSCIENTLLRLFVSLSSGRRTLERAFSSWLFRFSILCFLDQARRAWLCIMPRQFDNMPPVYLAMCQCIDNLEGIPASFDR